MRKEYQDKMVDKMTARFANLEDRIMQDIVRRINMAGKITSTADWQINRLKILGYSSEDIEASLKETLNATYPEMFELYDKVINWEYVRNKDVYEQINAEYIPYNENEQLKQITEGIKRQTRDELDNITQSLGFYLDYGDGRRVLTPLAQVYQGFLDAACMDIVSGAFDYNSVLRRVVTQLTNSGLRQIDYVSGRSNRIDVAARRAIMTGMSQITGKITDYNAEKLGVDHFEVAWHSGARPTHAVWQGKVWTKEQLINVCGLGSATGLLGINCYHEYYPFFPGISERNWTDEWLEEKKRQENTPKTFGGKEYTLYEAKQQQRKMETAMRAQREKVKLLEAGGADPDEVMLARAKYQGQLDEYARFSKKMGLPQERERIYLDMRGRVAPQRKTDVIKAANRILEKTKGRKFKMFDLISDNENGKIKVQKELNNFETLQMHFASKYSVVLSDDVKELDFTAVKESLIGLAKVLDEFPKAIPFLKHIGVFDGTQDDIMATDGLGTISFNKKIYYSYAVVNEISTKQEGGFINGSNVLSNGAHEAGHLLELTLCMLKETGWRRSDAWFTEKHSTNTFWKAIDQEICKATGKTPEQLVKDVSMYAYEGGNSEILAECVSDVIVNGKKASPLSKAVWDVLKKEME